MKNITSKIAGLAMLAGTLSLTSPAEASGLIGNEAYVDVAAATLWSNPAAARPGTDDESVSNPVNLWSWTKSMSYDEKLWLVGELETQALLGQKVDVIEEQGDWVKVAVHGQPTPRLAAGYPGWMPKSQLNLHDRYSNHADKPFALITSPTAWLYHNKNFKKKDLEISYNTRLPVVADLKEAFAVITPDGKTRWLSKDDASLYQSESEMPAATGTHLVKEAEKFLGLPYLWAGTAGFGFDCSGFTYTIHKAAGITIPRDSGPQSKEGLSVAREDLQPGDLLFFAYEQGKGRVHHVGMYIGDNKMIHSPNTASTVRIDSLDTPAYAVEYAGARRYIPAH
jgi:cell wall-associated NlpC family hydrolase